MKAEIYKDACYRRIGAAFEADNEQGYSLTERFILSVFSPKRSAKISED